MDQTQTTTEITGNVIDSIATLAKEAADKTPVSPIIVTDHKDLVPFVINEDWGLIDITNFLRIPISTPPLASFASVLSFCDYVNDCKSGKDWKTVLVMRQREKQVNAHFGYTVDVVADRKPFSHTATLAFDWSDAFAYMLKHNEHLCSQEDFASHLEWLDPYIIEPDGATLRTMALNLTITKDYELVSMIDPDTGDTKFNYRDENKPSGTFAFHRTIWLELPIFEGSELHTEVECRLSYRAQGDQIKFAYRIVRKEALISQAIEDMAGEIHEATGIPVYLCN